MKNKGAGIEFTNGGQPGVRLKKKEESVAGLNQQIENLGDRITHEEPTGAASPKKGMQQLRSAKDKNDLVKLKSRRAGIERRDKK